MKRLNILQVFILLFTVTMTVVSCSDEGEEVNQPEQTLIDAGQQKQDVDFIFNSIDKVITASAKNNFRDLELNQETLDYYQKVLNLPEGSVNMEMAEKIVGETRVVMEKGIDHILDQSNYSPYTVEKIKVVFIGESLEGIERDKEFQQLIPEEQKLLLTINSIMQESSEHILFQNKALNCTINGQPASGAACGAALGAVAGAVIGGIICGWPCAIGGAIIGGITGGILGGK